MEEKAKFGILPKYILTVIILLVAIVSVYAGRQPKVIFILGEKDSSFERPGKVAIDEKRKEIYVVDRDANAIRIFNWDGIRKGGFEAKKPVAIAFDAKEQVYVAEEEGQTINVYNFKGDKVDDFKITGLPAEIEKAQSRIYQISIDARGHFYFADILRKVVLVTDADGKYLSHFGAIGGDAKGIYFKSITSFCLLGKKKICILDGADAKVYIFKLDGEFILKFGEQGGATGKLSMPSAVVVDKDEQILVLDKHRHCISIYDKDGNHIREVGGKGKSKGWFYFPEFINADSEGRVYVSEPMLKRIQVIRLPPEKDVLKLTFSRIIDRYDASTSLKSSLALWLDTSHNEVFVADTGNNRIGIFTPDGVVVKIIEKNPTLTEPVGVAVAKSGEIFVAEKDGSSIKVLNQRGEIISEIDLSSYGKDLRPGRITLDSKDNLYVLDRANQQVLVFDDKRKFRIKFGQKGSKDGEFEAVQDVAVDEAGNIYVVSSQERAVGVFDPSGKYKYGFGKHGPAEEDFANPSGIAIDSKNRIWIADNFRHKLKVFDLNGKFIMEWGIFGDRKGELYDPVDIAFDTKGNIYVLEKGGGRLQVFTVAEEEPDTPESKKDVK